MPSGHPANFGPLADFDTGFLSVKANDRGQRELSVDVLANDSDPDDDHGYARPEWARSPLGAISIVESHNRKRLLYTTAEVDPPSRRVSYTIADGKGGIATGTPAILSPANGEYAGEALSADAAPGAARRGGEQEELAPRDLHPRRAHLHRWCCI